jgi:hypothetical protein
MKEIIERVCDIINNSDLSGEIIYGTIKDLGNKANLSDKEILQIIEDNYNEWEK